MKEEVAVARIIIGFLQYEAHRTMHWAAMRAILMFQ